MKKTTLFSFLLMAVFKLQAQTETLSFSLEEAKAYAVEHSYFTRQAVMDEEIAQKRVKETTGIGLPQISGSASFQDYITVPTMVLPAGTFGNPEPLETTFSQRYSATAGIAVSQILFDGSYIVGLQAAQVYRDLATNQRVKSEQDIKNDVTQAYAAVLVAQENIETLERNLELLKDTYEDTKAMYSEGFAEEQDADQLQILFSSTENTYENAKRYLVIAENLLKFQMGIEVASEVSLSDDLDMVVEYGKEKTLIAQQFSYSENIDFKIAKTNQDLQFLNLRNTKVSYLPRLNASFNYQQQHFSNSFSDINNYWYPATYWGLNLSVPIFSGGQRHFQVQQAKLEYEKASLQTEQASQNLIIQYNTAKADYIYTLSRYENTKNNLDLVQTIVEKETYKYQEGMSSSLNVANSQIQFLEIQSNYIQATLDLINAKSELDKILNNYQ